MPPPDDDVRSKWGLWEQLQANGAEVYDADPAGNLSVGERRGRPRVRGVRAADGRVLDVGCGPQALPSYSGGDHFVGIDPLPGGPREFAFVQGVAEYLPFRDARLRPCAVRDLARPHAVAAASDRRGATRAQAGRPRLRVARRAAATAAAARGASDSGERIRRPADAARATRRRKGAVDPFHFSHPRFATVLQWLTDAGFTIDREHRDEIGNCLVTAERP